MPKIEINKVVEVCKKNEIDPQVIRLMVEEMNNISQVEATEEKAPPVKKKYVMLVSDPLHKLPDHDFVGWIAQIPEDESDATTQDRIHKAVYEYNATRKGRLNPAKTVGEALEFIPTKHFKEADIWIKTKTPVLILRTDNEIPKDESSHVDRRTSGNQVTTGQPADAKSEGEVAA